MNNDVKRFLMDKGFTQVGNDFHKAPVVISHKTAGFTKMIVVMNGPDSFYIDVSPGHLWTLAGYLRYALNIIK